MENEETIDVLNTLITINNDRIEGYETAANETKEQDLKRLVESADPNDRKAAELVLNNSPLEAWKVLEKEETAY